MEGRDIELHRMRGCINHNSSGYKHCPEEELADKKVGSCSQLAGRVRDDGGEQEEIK